MFLLLLGRAMGNESGADHADGDSEGSCCYIKVCLLLGKDGCLNGTRPFPSVLRWPSDARPAVVIQNALPIPALLDVIGEIMGVI